MALLLAHVLVLTVALRTLYRSVAPASDADATTEARVQGTVVDTLLRHLLPVLLFAALVPATDLAVLAGLTAWSSSTYRSSSSS